MAHWQNGIELWNSLVGRKFHFVGQDLNIVGRITDLDTHGSFGEAIQFLNIEEELRPAYFEIGGVREATPTQHWKIVPDAIKSILEIKEPERRNLVPNPEYPIADFSVGGYEKSSFAEEPRHPLTDRLQRSDDYGHRPVG